ncbi:MAG TPA: MG2 domain-containing protein, partial [Anaerolinea sp.]|nr:MG2 domain-containing protein [Anaerolinea sp.]
MSRKSIFTLIAIVLFIAGVAGLFAATSFIARLPERLSQHETILLGQNRLVPGSQAALRVLVRDTANGAPLEGAEITVSLRPQDGGKAVALYTGKTAAQGTAEVAFRVPDGLAANQTLVVETRSRLGSDTIERPVTVERDYRVLLSSDKPIYQPGQVIHLRALALSAFDLTPAVSQPIEVTIADGKGNKVFRQTLTTSDFGAAWTDFQLASEVNTGAYKISATLGNTASEKTVQVENYVLPKFDVQMQTERTFYLPGQHVSGTLRAAYFYGKPVAGGQVHLEGYTFDVQRSVLLTLDGQTDSEGNYTFEFDLPAYLAGSDLEGGQARFYLQATVTDLAQHAETSNLSLPVSASALVIEAMPEGGIPRPGVENIIYLLTSYPDGTPANAALTVTFQNTGEQQSVDSGEYGLAELRYTPRDPYLQMTVEAQDRQGNSSHADFVFQGEWSEESVLLRPDQPVYRVGDTMNLSIFTTQPQGTVYLDIVRDGQAVSTRSVDVAEGKAALAVDLTPDLYGTLELHAYKILSSGSIARDTRMVVVDRAADLNLQITPGQDT